MMEKRNFVTDLRTPKEASASDIDDVVYAGAAIFGAGKGTPSKPDGFEKKASEEDNKTDEV